MVREIRLLGSESGGHSARLAAHVRDLQRDGPVVFVTADRPFATWAAAFAQAGVDLDALAVVDAVSAQGGLRPAMAPRNVVFLASPMLLEMVMVRVEQQAERLQAHHVVVDSISTLAFYNGVAATSAFVHHLASRLRGSSLGGHLVLRDDENRRLLSEHLLPFVDSSLPLTTAPA